MLQTVNPACEWVTALPMQFAQRVLMRALHPPRGTLGKNGGGDRRYGVAQLVAGAREEGGEEGRAGGGEERRAGGGHGGRVKQTGLVRGVWEGAGGARGARGEEGVEPNAVDAVTAPGKLILVSARGHSRHRIIANGGHLIQV
jgi:hypothetical protein